MSPHRTLKLFFLFIFCSFDRKNITFQDVNGRSFDFVKKKYLVYLWIRRLWVLGQKSKESFGLDPKKQRAVVFKTFFFLELLTILKMYTIHYYLSANDKNPNFPNI